MKCSLNGKSGWKYGSSGKCFTGPSGKKRAIKQGVAIEGPKKFSEVMKQEKGSGSENDPELIKLIAEVLLESDDRFYVAVDGYIAKKERDK